MILGFKRSFTDGTPTYFFEKIVQPFGHSKGRDEVPKIHSIRAGARWKPGNSIQMAYGVRTKNYWQFNENLPSLEVCISTQEVFMTFFDELAISVDSKRLGYAEVEMLIQNDGLTYNQFVQWFFPTGLGKFSGQIIHWTPFKY